MNNIIEQISANFGTRPLNKYIYDHGFILGISEGNLINFNIPDGVTEIGRGAFARCTSLTSITIPNSVTKIGREAFWGCTSLTSVTIPDSVTEIGECAFGKCTSLTSITIPDSVTRIGEGAFEGCTSLTFINIPDGVTEIGQRAFDGCTSLTSITIPDGVTRIGWGTFKKCTSLRSITIPDSVTEIGILAFDGCTSLTSITIPDSITTIDVQAFLECTSLTQIFCNNPDLLRDSILNVRNQIQPFIFPIDIESTGLNTASLSNNELNLLMRLNKEDYLPNWNTIANTFNARSMDQIRAILRYFNKTSCLFNTEKTLSLQKKNGNPTVIHGLNSLSMFLKPKEYANLSMTAKNITFNPRQETTFYCSMQ